MLFLPKACNHYGQHNRRNQRAPSFHSQNDFDSIGAQVKNIVTFGGFGCSEIAVPLSSCSRSIPMGSNSDISSPVIMILRAGRFINADVLVSTGKESKVGFHYKKRFDACFCISQRIKSPQSIRP